LAKSLSAAKPQPKRGADKAQRREERGEEYVLRGEVDEKVCATAVCWLQMVFFATQLSKIAHFTEIFLAKVVISLPSSRLCGLSDARTSFSRENFEENT